MIVHKMLMPVNVVPQKNLFQCKGMIMQERVLLCSAAIDYIASYAFPPTSNTYVRSE